MNQEITQVYWYIEHHSVKEYTIEERCTQFGHTITVTWVQDYIRCQATVFRKDEVVYKMGMQFELTKNLLKSNLK